MKIFRYFSDKILIFGLGNPGAKYKHSRHSIGREIVKDIANDYGVDLKEQAKLKSYLAEVRKDKQYLILGISSLFMNLSGESVLLTARYYKIKPKNIWIIHDDIDIAFGKIKLAKDKKSAGHRGVESVINHLGTQEFNRVRVGIWHRPFQEKNKALTENYVLEKFLPEEQKETSLIKKKAASLLEAALTSD